MSKHKDQGKMKPMFDEKTLAEAQKPSKAQIVEKILRLQEEVRLGQLDYDRLRPRHRTFAAALGDKSSIVIVIDGVRYSPTLVKSIVNFLNNWPRRRSQMVWEINELRKTIS